MAEISPPYPVFFWTLVFLSGGAAGSFLCLCVRRIPKNIPLVKPGSRCESCGKPVAKYANIPVAGFIICGGRCLRCGGKITWFYPVIETFCGAGGIAAVYVFGLSFDGLRCFVFLYGLIAAAAFDLQNMTVPDFVTLPFAATGMLLSIRPELFIYSVSGAAVGGGALLAASAAYKAVRKKDGMGMGDIKLMAGTGTFLGAADALLTIVAASAAGTVFGFIYLKTRGCGLSVPIPFAPFIAAGAIFFFFAN